MADKVRFVEPNVHYQQLKPQYDAIIQDVLGRGDLVYRQQLKEFEKHLAEFVGTRFAVGLNSGFHALHLSLIAAGIGAGDEVIVPAHTFVASVSAIVHVGATPVLVDVAADYNLDLAACARAITPRTRAIMPVHLNGRLCDMARLMALADEHHLLIVEDAAQALGASFQGRRAGAFGLTGCFSFYPFKVLGAFGDAGAITTNDERMATTVARLRYNGEDRATGEYHHHGYTCLLDNVQAAVLDMKLQHLPTWLDRRRQIAELYRTGLAGVGDLRLPHFPDTDYYDIYQNYVIRTQRRDALFEFLKDNGVETLIHWRKPMWQHAGLGLTDPRLPETVAICHEVISLPMNTEISDDNIRIVIATIRRFFQ